MLQRTNGTDRQTDRRTPCRYIDPAPPHTMRAVPPKMATSIRDQRKSRPPATTITLYPGQCVVSFLSVMRLALISHTYRNSIRCVDPEMSRRVYMHCTHFRKKNPFTKLHSDDRRSRRRLPVGRAECVFRMRLIGVKRVQLYNMREHDASHLRHELIIGISRRPQPRDRPNICPARHLPLVMVTHSLELGLHR